MEWWVIGIIALSYLVSGLALYFIKQRWNQWHADREGERQALRITRRIIRAGGNEK